MRFDDIIKEVSEELGLPTEVCRLAYRSSWKFIREKIESLPLKKDLTEEEFEELRPNFNLPSLGKLFVTKQNYKAKKKRYHIIKELQKHYGNNIQDREDSFGIQPDSDN